ncbi:hypothetical protein MSPP1_002105 [Malassezia sp. CBS 17886]|nr:hypothetical protein MSPP1_002105 [Malassezia sp. CBS 17886]
MSTPAGLDVRLWPQPMVLQWLQHLELDRYADNFLENDINGEALVLLDDASLRDLGVSSIGHRVTLLSEIFQLKEIHGIPLEPGDWIPQNYEPASSPTDWPAAIHERDERIQSLEFRVAQLSTGLLRLREDVMALARATGKPDVVHQASWFELHEPPQSNMARPMTTPNYERTPAPYQNTSAASPAMRSLADTRPAAGPSHTRGPTNTVGMSPAISDGADFHSPPTTSRSRAPITCASDAGQAMLQRRADPMDSAASSPAFLGEVPGAHGEPLSTGATVSFLPSGDLSPICDAVCEMLHTRGVPATSPLPHAGGAQVAADDTCSALLQNALHRFFIRDDWREYAMFISYGANERCLCYDEKPLLLYQKLRDAGQDPSFHVSSIRQVESPIVVAERRHARSGAADEPGMKQEPMRLRAVLVDTDEPTATTRVLSTSHLLRLPMLSGTRGEEAIRSARVRGPAAYVPLPDAQTQTYAIAIYPYHSEREDEFDVQTGDTFIVVSKTKGWWALRRDSVADGSGDVYIPHGSVLDGAGAPLFEIWTGWVPAGCLLEVARPLGDILYAQAGGVTSPASSIARHTLCSGPSTPTQALRTEILNAPIPSSMVMNSGSQGVLLVDYDPPACPLSLRAGDRVRVFKRYNFWSYCIAERPIPARGWIPSWSTSYGMPRLWWLACAVCACAIAAHAHGDHAHQVTEQERKAPVDFRLWVHIALETTSWAFLFPLAMVLGLVRHRLHVPVAILSVVLSLVGYLFAWKHGGRQFSHTVHGTMSQLMFVALVVQGSCGIYLKLHLSWRAEKWIRPTLVRVHGFLGCVFPVIGWTQMVFGIATLQSWCRGGHLGQCLAHYIMGSAFTAYAIILLIMMKCAVEWLRRTGCSQEMLDSVAILVWGIVNTFTEHHGGPWTHKDLQHTLMGVLWWAGGAAGVWLSRKGQRSVIPAIIIILTGWGMSGHAQALMISTRIHGLFGHTLMAGGVCRIIEICFVLHDKPTGSEPGPVPQGAWFTIRAFQYIPSFLLVASGIVFMSATDEELRWADAKGVDHVTWALIDFSVAFLIFFWSNVLIDTFVQYGGRYGLAGGSSASSTEPRGEHHDYASLARPTSTPHSEDAIPLAAYVSPTDAEPIRETHVIFDEEDDPFDDEQVTKKADHTERLSSAERTRDVDPTHLQGKSPTDDAKKHAPASKDLASNGDAGADSEAPASSDATGEADSEESAYNEETGEINWDCPCLGGMANGPCGEEFKQAFSCFVFSEKEPKGIECVDKFKLMQDCFREHPEVYAQEIEADEAAEDAAHIADLAEENA